ncbi:MAG: B12-binding domain-containing radical SAM protein [Actinobacteria bacterium]|nr:B12-binding domain-containing radical SAM protein [Actinomycetota bacterium]
MKVTFIYPDYFDDQNIHLQSQGRVYLGLAYLAAALRESGRECELIHLVKAPQKEQLLSMVENTKPDIIAFSSTTLQFSKVRTISKWIREHDQTPIVCGGVHPTIAPEDTALCEDIDFACVGEGEGVLLDLCEALEKGKPLENISGLLGKSGGRQFKNPPRPLICDLDSLPFPDRNIFQDINMAPNQKKRLTVMASRGCPFNCSYCCNHALKRVYPNPGSYTRFRSPENVIREIEQEFGNKPDLETIRFDDDILALNRLWLEEFSATYRSRIGKPYICNARADLLNENSVRLLAESGCSTIAIGIESGNLWLRKNVLQRSMTDDVICRAFRLCREYGIKTVSLNMVGFPHETVKMALDTVKINANIDPDLAQVTTLHPFPNTKIYDICKKDGMLCDSSTDTLFSGKSELELDTMSNDLVNMISENFVLLKVIYHKILKLPPVIRSLVTKTADFFIGSGILPIQYRSRILAKWRSKLDWKHFLGIDY